MQLNQPKISVLTPVNNAEKYIAESIESIITQTFSDFEFLIYNDCSTDRTLEIITEYVVKDPRIVVINGKEKLTIPECRNVLLKAAKGQYVVWQDADDISVSTRIASQYNLMETNKEIGICGGFLYIFDDQGKKIGIRKYHQNDTELRKRIFWYSPVAQPAAMIRRSVLQEAGYYDKKWTVCQDLDMSFRIGQISKFANIQFPIVKYRTHENSISAKKFKSQLINTFRIRMKYWLSPYYNHTLIDTLYLIVTLCMIIVPPSITLTFFRIYRDSSE